VFVQFFEHLWIKDRRADAVCAAGPFAKIDQAATIAAERKMLVGAQNDRLACWTAQAQSFLAGHTLNDACHQIVVVRLGDLTVIKLTWRERCARS
jgi:hypothetical protein